MYPREPRIPSRNRTVARPQLATEIASHSAEGGRSYTTGCIESINTRKMTAVTAKRAKEATKRNEDVKPETVDPTISSPTGKRARRMKVTSAREATEVLKEVQDCSSFWIWNEVSCRTNSVTSLPVARVFRNPWTKPLTLALGCPAKAFSATTVGDPGTKASSLANISASFVKAGKTRAPIAETRLKPSCRLGFASCTNTDKVIRKNGSSESVALLLELARDRSTTTGVDWTNANAPTISNACSTGSKRRASASAGDRSTSSETRNLE